MILPLTTSSEARTPAAIERWEIDEALFLYEAKSRFIVTASYDGSLRAEFASFEHPWAAFPIAHFTREQAVLLATQSAYLLAFRMARAGKLASLDVATLRDRCISEEALLTRIELLFRQKIANRPGLAIHLAPKRIRAYDGAIHFPMSFDFEDGGCSGECEGWIRI